MKLLNAAKAFFLIIFSDSYFVATIENENLITFGDISVSRFKEVSKHVIDYSEIPESIDNEIRELLKK